MDTTTNTITAPPVTLDMPAAAQSLGISERKLWALTKAGKVPHVRIGRRLLYPVHLLQRWLEEMATATAAEASDGTTNIDHHASAR